MFHPLLSCKYKKLDIWEPVQKRRSQPGEGEERLMIRRSLLHFDTLTFILTPSLSRFIGLDAHTHTHTLWGGCGLFKTYCMNFAICCKTVI